MASARAGLELPATSLIAPLLAAIAVSKVGVARSRRPDNKAAARLAIRGRPQVHDFSRAYAAVSGL